MPMHMYSFMCSLKVRSVRFALVLTVMCGLGFVGWRVAASERGLQAVNPWPLAEHWQPLRHALASFGVGAQTVMAVDDNQTATEDTPAAFAVLANDQNVPANAALVITAPPAQGTATLGANNTLNYTPGTHFSGTATFQYGINANAQPTTANDDTGAMLINTSKTLNVLANDFDPQNDPLTVTIQTPPAQGTAVVNGDKTITYTPPNGFTGQATFVYKIDDGNGNMATATVRIDVRLALSASTLHYLPPQYALSGHASYASQIWVNTDDPNGAMGTISVPGGTSINFTINSTTSFTQSLTNDTFGRTTVRNTIETKGLIVSSNNPVSVQMVQENSNGQSFLVSKGLVALGQDFYAGQMGMINGYEGNGISVIAVMATENSTSVTIQRPPSAAWNWSGHASGTINLTLNAGQSYLAYVDTAAQDMTGARVTSNKPVAVSNGSFGVNMPGATDNGWDQIVPVEKIGTKYVIVGSDSSPDVTDFVATQNGTQISVDGVSVGTFNAGQYYRLNLTSSLALSPPEVKTITASAPVYAYQNAGLVTNSGENGLALVAPVNTSSRGVWRFRTPNPTGRAFFLTTTSAAASMTLTNVTGGGNTNVSLGTATQVPGDASLSYFLVGNLDDSAEFKVQANAFIQITLFTGGGGGGGIGYFGGFTPSDLTATDDAVTVLTGIPLTFTPLGNDIDGSGDPITITNISQPASGTVTNNGNGTLTYTPAMGFTGNTSFTYTVTDGNGNFSTATINVTVTTLPSATVTVKVAPVADPIPITANNVGGAANQALPLSITVGNSADTDGSETRGNAVTISNVPASVSFSAGTNNGGGVWTIPLASLAGLTLTGTTAGTFTLTAAISNSDAATFSDSTMVTDTASFSDVFVLTLSASETVSKSGMAGATPPGGNGTATINWRINYGLASNTLQPTLTLNDTWSAGQTLVAASVQTPGGLWASASGGNALTLSNALVAPNAKGNAVPFPRPLAGGVLLTGAGDGFNPVITANGRVMGINHHLTNAPIWCYDLNIGASCAGYPMASGIATGVDPYTVAIGNRIYVNPDSEDGQCCGAPGLDRIYCWDAATNSTCGQSPSTTGKSSVLTAANGKLFTVNQSGELRCFDPSNGLNTCAGFTTVNLGITALGGYNSASEDLFAVGSKLYIANHQRKLTCFDVTTNTTCAGWPALPTVVNTTATGNARSNLFPRLSAGGSITGICVAGNNTDATCYDFDSGNPTEINLGGVHRALTGINGNADVYVGSRVFFANYQNGDKLSCFDWATQAPCTGAGFTGGFTVDANRPYGLGTDGVSVFSYGDAAVLQSWNPLTGVTPSNRTATTVTVNVDSFYCGAPVAATWDKVILSDINLTAGVEFNSVLVSVLDTATGTTVFGPTEAIGTAGSFDISSVPSSIRTLRLQISESPVNTVAWDDSIPPKATLTFTNGTPVRFCYQTQVTCSGTPTNYTNTIATTLDPHSDMVTVTACAPSPNLALSKSAPAPALSVGQNSTYTLTVTNNGTADASTATVKDTLPIGLDLVSATGSGWTCTPDGATSSPVGTLTCHFSGTLTQAGGTSAISVVVKPIATYGGNTLINYAAVDPTSGASPPPPTNCTAANTPAGCAAPVSGTVATNAAPTISGATLAGIQGTGATTMQLATVGDAEQAANTLTVLVTPLTGMGITVGTPAIDAAGNVTASLTLDCTATTSTFNVTVTDSSNAMTTALLTVNVAANTPPTLTYVTPQAVTAGQALTITPTAATDNGSITGFSVQSVTPPLTTPPTVNAAGVVALTAAGPSGPHDIVIRALDNCGLPTDFTIRVNVNCQSFTLNPATLPNGQAGIPYNQAFTTVGSIGVVTFSLNSGALPPGLSLVTGAITGTPTTLGSFTFEIKATDVNGCLAFRTYNSVQIGCPTYALTALPAATANVAYNQALSVTPNSGGPHSYSFTGTLPPGLTLNSAGVLSGTPTTTGTYNFTVTAQGSGDFSGCTGSKSYSLVVHCYPITLTPSLPGGVQGMNYNQTVTASPSGGVYSYAVVTNALPPGLTLNSATGAITGILTAPGNYTFSIQATRWGTCAGTQNYNVTITGTCNPLSLNPVTLPNPVTGATYHQTLSVTGGTGPHSYAVTQGNLPPGLTLNPSSGVLSGTPTVGGIFNFRIMATGSGGCTGSRAYALTLGCPTVAFSPTATALPDSIRGVTYSQTITVTPASNFTFSILLGQLPHGFTLNAQTGVISGITDQTGLFNFTIKVSGSSCQALKAYSITVRASAAALAQMNDYDGDGKSDLALYAANGVWRLLRSSDQQAQTALWGTAGDVPLSGDYDGDGKTDLAVFRPSDGTWYIKHSRDGSSRVKAWGLSTDVPVPGDYDGDGKTDIAVWRGAEGNWYIWRSSDQQSSVTVWGTGAAQYNDLPVPGDYDGDGKTDLAVFRRSNGFWYARLSGGAGVLTKLWGTGTDVPVVNDYDGDGKADLAVWRATQGVWYILSSSTGAVRTEAWGAGYAPYFDQALPGDYDGDGQADLAVWRVANATWYLLLSAQDASHATRIVGQGLSTDAPVSPRRP